MLIFGFNLLTYTLKLSKKAIVLIIVGVNVSRRRRRRRRRSECLARSLRDCASEYVRIMRSQRSYFGGQIK
jgi:hypothetical protein